MKIPTEILLKYKINTNDLCMYSDDTSIYYAFLNRTDFEIIKGFESLLSEPTKFLSNLVELAKTLKEVSGYRSLARQEIEGCDD